MPASLRFQTWDVFTETAYAGNPLAVVFGGEHLSRAQMQTLAREFNLSETVFVLPATREDCRWRLRIFTPATELPFAGHPTLGAACALADPHAGEQTFQLEEAVAAVAVRVQSSSQRPAYAELVAPRLPVAHTSVPDATAVMPALGLAPEDLAGNGEPFGVVDGGVPFLLVPLRTPELLAGIDVDAQALRAVLGGDARGVYVHARGYEGELRARMFAPALGVAEDPATGSAAVALAAALGWAMPDDGRHSWCIHQGVEMGRPSRLHISADRDAGQLTAVRVGGHAVVIAEGTLRHP